MKFPGDRPLLLILALMAALLVWGSLHALGTYLYGNHDFRKPLIVYACMGVFLGGWGLMLWQRSRRLRHEHEEPTKSPKVDENRP